MKMDEDEELWEVWRVESVMQNGWRCMG